MIKKLSEHNEAKHKLYFSAWSSLVRDKPNDDV